MQRLREKAIARVLSCILTLCLGLVILSPSARADASEFDYGIWLRLHLPDTLPSHVEQALQRASKQEARTFNEFLNSFGEELESLTGTLTAANPDATEGQPAESLIMELRFEFARLVGDALLQRTSAVMAATSTANVTQARSGGYGMLYRSIQDTVIPAAWNESGNRFGGNSGTFRHSASQPLGP